MAINWQTYIDGLVKGDIRAIARTISLVENEVPGYDTLLQNLPPASAAGIIGITGPPGAGKSTLADSLIGYCLAQQKKIAVLCVDPSSPFNLGAVLGDRIRMSQWYNHPDVYIRSLATRGSLGGLHPKIIEITELLKSAAFDLILVETVGVGQSEIEIAGLADVTTVVLIPEGGDEVQMMKAGLMEIADIFVVNKADRPDAAQLVKNLRLMLSQAAVPDVPVIKTMALQQEGITELFDAIMQQLARQEHNTRKAWLLTERAYHLVQQKRMKDISKTAMLASIEKELQQNHFNLYRFVQQY